MGAVVGTGPDAALLAVKVGHTTNLDSRHSQMQANCPLEIRYCCYWKTRTVEEARQIEKTAHSDHKNAHLRGEWFAGSSVADIIFGITGHLNFPDYVDSEISRFPADDIAWMKLRQEIVGF
jgi:hypothetical protein